MFFVLLNERFDSRLAADVDGAKAEDDVTAGCGTAKTQHRTEAREDQNLIELVADIRRVGAGEDVVSGHLTVGAHSDVDEKIIVL